MKKVILAVSVLLVIVVAGILETVYIHKIFTQMDDKLYSAEAAILIESPDSLEKVNEITGLWESKRRYMELFTFSPDLRAFSAALGETQGSLKCGDFKNAASKIRSLIVMSDNIHKILDFNVEDII